MDNTTPKKRGRPAKIKTNDSQPLGELGPSALLEPKTIEVVKEVVIERTIEVPQKQLEGFELYKKLKDLGFFQGGIGQFQEDMNGTERVYLPHASEIYAQFAQNPQGWDTIRDYLARAFVELHETK